MKLRLIRSGGQTGADRTALECAKARGIETGGWVPKNCKTETGLDPILLDFGCKETPTADYQTRTRWNVRDADITVWFGNINSPGFWCTKNATYVYHKDLIKNPTPGEFKMLCNMYEHINVAGNRASTNGGVIGLVQTAFASLDESDE